MVKNWHLLYFLDRYTSIFLFGWVGVGTGFGSLGSWGAFFSMTPWTTNTSLGCCFQTSIWLSQACGQWNELHLCYCAAKCIWTWVVLCKRAADSAQWKLEFSLWQIFHSCRIWWGAILMLESCGCKTATSVDIPTLQLCCCVDYLSHGEELVSSSFHQAQFRIETCKKFWTDHVPNYKVLLRASDISWTICQRQSEGT